MQVWSIHQKVNPTFNLNRMSRNHFKEHFSCDHHHKVGNDGLTTFLNLGKIQLTFLKLRSYTFRLLRKYIFLVNSKWAGNATEIYLPIFRPRWFLFYYFYFHFFVSWQRKMIKSSVYYGEKLEREEFNFYHKFNNLAFFVASFADWQCIL